MSETVLVSTPEMVRDKPPLQNMWSPGDGKTYWEGTQIEVDYDELIRLGYFEERKVCPTCSGVGHLPKDENGGS